MLTKSCEYAIRTVVFVALNNKVNNEGSNEVHKVGIKEITKGLAFPGPFIAKILQGLVKAKLLVSTKGPHGGFYLKKSPEKISVLDIIEAVDGVELFQNCTLGLKKCSEVRPCPVHNSVKEYRNQLKKAFSDRTLDLVIEDIKNKKAFL